MVRGHASRLAGGSCSAGPSTTGSATLGCRGLGWLWHFLGCSTSVSDGRTVATQFGVDARVLPRESDGRLSVSPFDSAQGDDNRRQECGARPLSVFGYVTSGILELGSMWHSWCVRGHTSSSASRSGSARPRTTGIMSGFTVTELPRNPTCGSMYLCVHHLVTGNWVGIAIFSLPG